MASPGVHAADPVRGASLYATTPEAGLLVCIDCHGDRPEVNNFGNIWVGRNAPALIQRAITANTGGMGYFSRFYGTDELADIAAYLGNAPTALQFATTRPGDTSVAQTVTVRSSTKAGIDGLALGVEGDFAVVGGNCGSSVARFDSCSVEVAFRPTAAGPRSGALTIAHDGTPTPVRVSLTGEGAQRPPPLASVTPATLDFGDTPAGASGLRRNAMLANEGSEPLVIGSIGAAPEDFGVAGGSCLPRLVLGPGERCAVAVQFQPLAVGARAGSLTITHSGAGGASRVSLTGDALDGPAARLQADVPGIHLGTVAVGSRGSAHTATLRNTGTAALRWGRVHTTDRALAIVADACSRTTLAAGAACPIAVAFVPGRPGWTSGSLRVTDADGATALQLPLAGRARPAAGLLKGPAAAARFDETVGQTTLRRVRVVNAGGAAVRLGPLAIEGSAARQFALRSDGSCAAALSLPPATGCDVVIAFTPVTAGRHAATLRVDADGGGARLTAPLVGHAFAGARASPWVDATQVGFAEQALGDAMLDERSIDIVNRGAAALAWQTLALAGDDAADFAIAGSCRAGIAVAPGERCRVGLRFAPRAAGDRAATLVLRGQGDAAPIVVSLTGRAVARARPRLVVDAAGIDFGTQPLPAAPAQRSLTIRNVGSGPSMPPRLGVEGPFRIAGVDPACTQALAAGESCRVRVAFVPAGPGPAEGRLVVAAAGSRSMEVHLGAHATGSAPRLEWQSAPTMPAATAVGAVSEAASWTLVNTGNAATPPSYWALSGAAAGDYSLAAASRCGDGGVLAPGHSCNVRVTFHPTAPGPRPARLALLADGPLIEAGLDSEASAPVADVARSWPPAVTFAAVPGEPTAAQSAWLVNDGPTALDAAAIELQGPGFEAAPPTAQSCGPAPFALLPGDTCAVPIRWNGTADGQLGGTLRLGTRDDPAALSAPLAVDEDPALRSNVGGGASGGWWLLALAAAAALARRAGGRESRHA